MRDLITEKVMTYCEQAQLIAPGDHVVVGISGGPDSVCLFLMLQQMRESCPFALRMVHVHHGIRSEAEEDLQFVEALGRRYQVPCRIFREDVPAYAKAQKLTEEEAGREVRYRDLEEERVAWMQEEGGEDATYKIATAHHLNDQAETVLMHLFRGSGLRGLTGMRAKRLPLIRPLLCLTKVEILAYLEQEGEPYCIDRTNADQRYLRNRIRNRILPELETQVTQDVQAHIAQTAQILQEAEDYLAAQIDQAYWQARLQDRLFRVSQLQQLAPFLQKEVLRKAIAESGAGEKDLTYRNLCAVAALLTSNEGGKVSLPHGVVATRRYDVLEITKDEAQASLGAQYLREKGLFLSYAPERPHLISGVCGEEAGAQRCTGKIRGGVSDAQTLENTQISAGENVYTQFFDYDKMNPNLILRHREEGDYLIIDREGHKKSLHRFLIDEKIPKELREMLWVVADESHIVWIPGYRVGSDVAVTAQTRRILSLSLKEDAQAGS
ncbi:MAG: tRNA lysidine(34) synthetase TilS [Lachnospiraceae bacterium]|nr:tRNA lysidine(34) synthetase TilS [Lachnospiraceae bacterium]